ncbi:MAG: hypothetical protein NVV62_16175 [Terricaulis sp.]|nr:hypothetical protein [Terricaulis sp.]
MELSALAANAALSMLFGAKQRENAAEAGFAAPAQPANSAQPAPNLPGALSNISFDAVLFLQSEEPQAPAISAPTPTEIFLEEIQKDPIERMREQILEELGLTEEDLAAMGPDERRATEDKISAMIEEKLRQGFGARSRPQTAAEYLTELRA